MRIILASKSPRRQELLRNLGLEYECMVSEKEEKITSSNPESVVKELSAQKAEDVLKTAGLSRISETAIIIGADTVVADGNEIMGKPSDENDAKRMLKNLSGKKHSVWTGVTIIFANTDGKGIKSETFACKTDVYMYDISEKEIDEYIKTGEPSDKAGAYGIQGMAMKFIEKIEGDYNNVVGLPVSALYQKIKNTIE